MIAFARVFSERARADVKSIVIFLDERDEDASIRFEERLDVLTAQLCERIPLEIAQVGKPFSAPDDSASIVFAQPVYRLKVETAKRRARRSSSGLWYVFYSLTDSDSDAIVDTLLVHRVRHSAARPLSVEGETEADE